jgi:signal transduction histidine kinase
VAPSRSLRRRLAFGYAGIALLTVLVLGAVLAVALPPFFRGLEQDYLRASTADAVHRLQEAGGVGPENANAISAEVIRIAEANRVRVRIYDRGGRLIADSGPGQLPANPSPAALTSPITNRTGQPVGEIELTGGPRAGSGLASSIALAWAIAGLLAVVVSAVAGYLLARRVSGPIADLTRVSAEMARGDLSVRATVAGDAETQQLASAFNEMADGIEETLGSLERFVGDAAHEIGTPLTALQADLELARDDPADPRVPELLDRSLTHAERIRRLTRDLLVLSRLESAGGVSEMQRVDLAETAGAAMDAIASRAEQADVDMVLETAPADASPGALTVAGDPSALARVLSNLLDNAVKFTPAGGTVTLSLAREGRVAVMRVADTGRGISAEDLPHVFDRFHRARDAASVPGSGLGLSIAKAIVDAHRGTILCESVAESAAGAAGPAGTTFEVRLPLAG